MSGTTPIAFGKLSAEVLERLVLPHLGAARDEVLVGPAPGRDAAVIRIGAGRVMAVTADPISYIPALGAERSAWLSCHLIASDLWTSGIPPAYAAVTLSPSADLDDDQLGRFVAAMGAEWARLGVAVVTGHTGRYDGGGDSTLVGACTLIGVGDEGRTVGHAHVKPGDRVLITKGCAIETAAIAAQLFPQRLAARIDEEGMARLRGLINRVSVVDDCRIALRAGVRDRGISALHDATEGGVLGGLLEVAQACGHDLRIERARIPLADEVREACEEFAVDPYWTLSEGTLIATARPARAAEVLAAWREEGIAAAEIGEVIAGAGRLWLSEPDGSIGTLDRALPDPYWAAYARAVREGWS